MIKIEIIFNKNHFLLEKCQNNLYIKYYYCCFFKHLTIFLFFYQKMDVLCELLP